MSIILDPLYLEVVYSEEKGKADEDNEKEGTIPEDKVIGRIFLNHK